MNTTQTSPASTADPVPSAVAERSVLMDLLGSVGRGRDGRLDIPTPDLAGDLHTLLTWAREHDVSLDGLDARAASLESVFLEIAGGGSAGSVPADPASLDPAADPTPIGV